jgi:hypothetical protein
VTAVIATSIAVEKMRIAFDTASIAKVLSAGIASLLTRR